MGLAKEYRDAWYHSDHTVQVHAGKKATGETYELLCPGVAVMIGYIERKRLEKGCESFSVSWQRFKQERPSNVKDSKNKQCLCPHHLQHQCFVTALADHRILTHKKKANGWGAAAAMAPSSDCPSGTNCPGASCTRIHRDVTYGMTCVSRGKPSPGVMGENTVDIAAYERVADLPPRRCFCIDGKGQFCDSCWLDDPTLQHPTAGTAKNIPVEDQEIYRAKITRAVGTCELEESEKYDIDCVVKKKVTETKGKGTVGKEKYAFVSETMSIKQFFKRWTFYIPIFLIHAFTASWQARQLGGENGIIKVWGGNNATVQIDYSENWTHTVKFEHQSAYVFVLYAFLFVICIMSCVFIVVRLILFLFRTVCCVCVMCCVCKRVKFHHPLHTPLKKLLVKVEQHVGTCHSMS